MDVLKNKQTKQYSSISRYTTFPYYYNTLDNKWIYGLTSHLDTDVNYTIHTVKSEDTLESLSLYYYGRPDYYWVIADFNRIIDSYIKLSTKFKTLKIPDLSVIKFED